MKYLFTVGVLFSLIFGVGITHVTAHGGVDHATDAEAVAHEASLEQIIELLKQVVALLIAKRDLPQGSSIVVPIEITDETEESMMEEHHTEHSVESETEAEPTARLVIEIEAHNGNTHVHVRYTDKPEEMFFVTSPLSDEAGVIRDTAARTRLAEDVIREALVYTGIE
jgi:hypothetical protein